MLIGIPQIRDKLCEITKKRGLSIFYIVNTCLLVTVADTHECLLVIVADNQ